MADDLAMAERATPLAGEELDDACSDAMADYLAGSQRGRLGTVATSPELFGFDEVELRERFAPYSERFLR